MNIKRFYKQIAKLEHVFILLCLFIVNSGPVQIAQAAPSPWIFANELHNVYGSNTIAPLSNSFSDNFSTDPNINGNWRINRESGNPMYEGSWDSTNKIWYLTRAGGYLGVATFANYQLKAHRWEAQFRYQSGGGSGADGFTFMFYKNDSYSVGAGGWLGFQCDNCYSGISGYGIEFDNYQNSDWADPSGNHIALIKDSVGNHLAYTNDSRTEDNVWHNVLIQFDNGHVVVNVDGGIVLDYVIAYPNYAFSGIGFSASTALYTNNHIIDDFVLRTEPPKSPLVLVHGWNGMGVPPPLCSSIQVNPDRYFEQVDQNLKDAGYYVGYANLKSSPCYTPPLVDNVPNIMAAIDAAKAANPGQSKVILITHSMGGLVARAYIEGPNYRNDVAALFTFGSPHLGTPDDLIAFLLNGVSLGNACKNYQPAACDFSVLGMKLFNTNHHQNNSVTYHAISGSVPFLSQNAWGFATYPLIGAGDGIVSKGSGTGLTGSLDRWITDESHVPLFGSRTYFIRDGGASTSYIQCIKKVLIDGASNCGSVSTASATQQSTPTKMISLQSSSTPTLAQHTPVEYSTLQSGQVATRNISIEGGPTLFVSQWQSGTLAFTLVAPNGQTITPAFATANPSIVTYSGDTNAGTYYFPNAIAGTWQLILQSLSVPAGGTTFSDFVAFDSNVAITGNLDKQWYTPTTPATIVATLAGLPSSGTVTAYVLRSDNVTDTVPLLSIGDGQYQASYTVPNAPGYAEVRLVATGTTASGLPFERGTSLAFQISPNTFSLNSTYTDTPSLYPGLPSYQFLNVTVGVNASVSGKVGLSADLVDGSGNFVAHGLTIQDVTAGPTILSLQFSGADILASQRNGRYTLTNLLLTDESGTTLVTQQAQAVYVTAPYLYTEFDIYPPSVSSITRSNTNPTNLDSVNFTVTFSETVTDVDTSDFALTSTGITGAMITNISGSGSTYTVTVNTGAGNGTIRLDVVDDDSIKDVAKNPLGGAGAGNGNYSSGDIYDITKTYIMGNVGVAGASLNYIDGIFKTVTADGNGNYTINVLTGWSGMVMPYKTGYTFTPISKSYSNLQSNQTSQNYTATTCIGCADVNVTLGGTSAGNYTLASGGMVYPRYGINGGPVHVVSTNAQPIFTSQRAKYGSSFNSIVGYPGNQLTTEYWFTSLDDLGMITYLVIGNPSTTLTAHVDVYIAGTKMNLTPYSIAPGQRVFPRYGINGGPVHVVSDIPIFTSERTKYGNSFNEVLGYPANQLTTEYWFTSLDDLGMITYLVIGNPSTVDTALVDVYIAGNKMNPTPYSIAPGQRVFPRYGINGGPVQVVSTNGVPIFTSERTKYGNSFNEVLGYPDSKLTTESWFTSLDDAGMITYLVIGNPSTTLTANVDVYIAGNKMNPTPYAITPGQRVFPRYGINGGPVQVVSDIPIFTSERSKYQSSFNEILGIPNTELTTDYWFTSLDDLGMITYLVITAP